MSTRTAQSEADSHIAGVIAPAEEAAPHRPPHSVIEAAIAASERDDHRPMFSLLAEYPQLRAEDFALTPKELAAIQRAATGADVHVRGQDHDGILPGLRAMDVTARRRKGAVDEEALNAEATGEEISSRAHALSAIASTSSDDDRATIREQARALDEARRAIAELTPKLQEAEKELAIARTTGVDLAKQLSEEEREVRDLVEQNTEYLDRILSLEERLARLTDHGAPPPTSIEAALEQLFDAEAVFAIWEEKANLARFGKLQAYIARDREEVGAKIRLCGTGGVRGELGKPGAMSPTEAEKRLEEDPIYGPLAGAVREANRVADNAETELRKATSRVQTLRVTVDAFAHRSPLTMRAAAIRGHTAAPNSET